jgi:3-phenylpropionate/cinnamic acid dioxygenase small subunit
MSALPSSADFGLVQQAQAFLHREARLLDEGRLDEWLALLTVDVYYCAPLLSNVATADADARERTRPGAEVCWFDEGITTLTARVRQLQTQLHWAEEPRSRVTRVIANIEVLQPTGGTSTEPAEPAELETACTFILYRNRVADETDILAGRRYDTLRRVQGEWRLAGRTILLSQNVLLAKNLTTIF